MRILLGFSNLGYQNYHYFCKSLKEKFINTEFIAFRSNASYVHSYLKNQKKINYIFTEKEPNFEVKEFKIDYNYLNYFEKEILGCSIWKIIASDRSIGKIYENGVRNEDLKFNYKSNRNYLLKFFAYRVQCIKKIFEIYKPDYFIPAIAMCSIDTAIGSQFAKFYGVKYAVLNWLRVDNYCSYAYDYQLNVKFLEKELKDSVENNFNKEMSLDVEKLCEETINRTKIKNIGKNENSKFGISLNYFEKYKIFFRFFGWPILILKAIYVSFRNNCNSLKTKKTTFNSSKNKITSINFLNSFFREFVAKIIFYREVFRLRNIGLHYLPEKENYIYFPLQVQPEYATNIQATMWMNNLNIIENLSKSIPHDWYIYVKEHPGMMMDRIRPKNYHSNIIKYPNVRLLNVSLDSNKIILNSKAVMSTSGTTAFDAILLSKPVIETRKNVWSNLNLSKICTDVEDLYEAIRDETSRISEISQQKRDQLIKHYFDSVLKFGFKQKNIKEAFYNLQSEEEEHKKCGYSMAQGFLKYLNYLEKN